MNRLYGMVALLALSVVIAAPGVADEYRLESDWLDLVKGYKGATMGAELVDIADEEITGTRRVTIAIPKAAVGDRNEIEEVVVVGRRPAKPAPLDIEYEWVDDYDSDRYGLVIHLGKGEIWPIRLYMNSASGFTR